MGAVQIARSWALKSVDLAVLSELEGPNQPSVYAAIGADGNLYSWSQADVKPSRLATTSNTDPFVVGSLYLTMDNGVPYAMVLSSNHIYCYDARAKKGIGIIKLPESFTCREIRYYWSPRLKKTLVMAQGIYSGSAALYYGEIVPSKATANWFWWGYGFTKRALFVEGGKTLWAFCPYGIQNSQYLSYCWCWISEDRRWSDWTSMSYIGSDRNITSLAGGTARETEGGYAFATTNNEGAHLIIANGSKDAYPKITGDLLSASEFTQPIKDVRTISAVNEIMFFYLINNTVYTAYAWPKEIVWMAPGALLDNVTCIATIAEQPADPRGQIYSITYCDGVKTHLALWNAGGE